MDKTKRQKILQKIKNNISDNYVIIAFFGNIDINEQSPDVRMDKELIWYKSNIPLESKFSQTNHEYMYIEYTKKGLGVINKIWDFPTNAGYNNKSKIFQWTQRIAEKPKELFMALFRRFEAKKILDPFAGYGNTIRAAMDLGIKIDACDLDDTLDYSEFADYTPPPKTEQTSLEDFDN